MKLRLALTFVVFVAGAAQAQEEAMRAGRVLAEQTRPLWECLKSEIDKARPASNDEAQLIARTACIDVAAIVRPKLIEATRAQSDPLPPTIDPEKVADGVLQMVRVSAYWDFTGELKAFNERIKKRAEERLGKR